VGLPDTAVQESRERVQAAIKNAGLEFPRKRVVVNLAPASVRKEGPAYDLPIAIGVMAMMGVIPQQALEKVLIVGELSLDGTVRHTRGILPMAALARENNFEQIIVPFADANEAALIPELTVVPVQNLSELYLHLTHQQIITPHTISNTEVAEPFIQTDFQEIKGQEHVKRALEVAAAGGHNVLMSGSPGSGKTLLAHAMPAILPSLSIDEALDVTRIYSVADMLPQDTPLIQWRPFRAPHHTISHAGLVGGGNWPHPGEVSLAHRGVLFLDELPEFGPRVLEVLRQPIEDKVVTISRAQGTLSFPANFMLVAAMNPCPCGFYGDPTRPCTCAMGTIQKYQKRISGPLLDRIDIHIQVPRVEYDKLSEKRLGEPSAVIRQRVEAARQKQRTRFANDGTSILVCNADMRPAEIRKYCGLDDAGKNLIKSAMNQMNLTARAYHRILKLARTIADLTDTDQISVTHLAEALQYRARIMD
jgi:magnesium chelatase family protein